MELERDNSTTASFPISTLTPTKSSSGSNTPSSPLRETNMPYPMAFSLSLFQHAMHVNPLNQSAYLTLPRLTLPNFFNLAYINLDATNLLVWKSQMESAVVCYDLLKFVDGSIPSPSRLLVDATDNTILNPYYPAWVKTDQCVLTWIATTLSYEIHKEVHDLRTSRELWQALALV